MADNKPILCLDFDGVIHDYKEGWRDGTIYGHVTPGFFEWAKEAQKHFDLAIYSSRTREQSEEMEKWLIKEGWDMDEIQFQFPSYKPPAFLTIDDRAILFTGDWSVLDPVKLRKFRPWNVSTSNG